jgi:hypothetical protein
MGHLDGYPDARALEAPWALPDRHPEDARPWARTALDASGDVRPDAAAGAGRRVLAGVDAEK